MRLRPGAVLWAATFVPATFVAAWLLATLPLLLGDAYHVLPATALGVAVAIALAAIALRSIPDDLDWVPVLAILAIAVGFGVLAALTSGEPMLVRRDPGTYTITALAYAQHGQSTIATHAAAFGHDPALIYHSQGFYPQPGGDHVVPQFLAGLPLLLSIGGWAAGVTGIALTNAALAAASVVSVGLFATRLLAGRWAIVATLAFAAVQPLLVTARTAHSEPTVALLTFAAFTLLWEAKPNRRGVYAVAGLLASVGSIARLDVFAISALIGVYALTLFVRQRRRDAIELAAGLLVGCGLGVLDAQLIAANYSHDVAHKMVATAIALGGLAVVCAGVAFVATRTRAGRAARRYLPTIAAVTVVVAAALAWTRPWWETVHLTHQPALSREFMSSLQAEQHMTIDPTRSYAEHSLHWISWYAGPPALILAVVGCAFLVRRSLAGWLPRAAPFLLVFVGTAAFWLWRPSISPDHPWADRRFVATVFPGIALCATWLLMTSTARVRSIPWRRTATATGVIVVVVPALVLTSLIAYQRPNEGELAGVQAACRAVGEDVAVLAIGEGASTTLPPALRAECGVPVALLADPKNVGAIPRLAAETARNGRRLILVATKRSDLEVPAAGTAVLAGRYAGRVDYQWLNRPETRLGRFVLEIWTAPVRVSA